MPGTPRHGVPRTSERKADPMNDYCLEWMVKQRIAELRATATAWRRADHEDPHAGSVAGSWDPS